VVLPLGDLAQNLTVTPSLNTWEQRIRWDIKNEYGPGWSVSSQSGKTKLTRRYADGSRSSVMLDIPFTSGNKRELLIAVGTHVERMRDQAISLRESHSRTKLSVSNPEGRFDWNHAKDTYFDSRKDLGPGTQRNTIARIEKLLSCLESKPRPKDGAELMARFVRLHLDAADLRPGSTGRVKSMQEVAKFLRFCVIQLGLPQQWLPLQGERLQRLVGAADGRDARLTPPIRNEDFSAFLDQLKHDARDDLHLAVGLVGLFGLRPAELAVLALEDGDLHCGQVKRNAVDIRRSAQEQARQKRRMVLPLDLPGKDGLGLELVRQWSTGDVKLPLAITTAIKTSERIGAYKPVGDAFRQLLDRYRPWRILVRANEGITPYSLRHSWAWRAHKGYVRSLSVRDAAALMGHSPETHHKFYGTWVTKEDLKDATARLNEPRQTKSQQA
tara:strand:- start:412 stop:1734 length:1323 start_codon:yes stop_codon:yes gene_type:complete